MEYQVGQPGRMIYCRIDHGEDLLARLEEVCVRETIRCGWIQLFGGLRRTDLVIGPEEPTMPPDPVWSRLEDCREALGIGSVFWDGTTPKIHLHGALGHHGHTVTGCIRKLAEIYLLIEVVICEVTGIDVTRPWYEAGQFARPEFGRGGAVS